MFQRRLPAPWFVETLAECFCVRTADGQAVAWVYYEDEETRRSSMRRLTRDEARRVAANIAKLPELVGAKL